MLHAVDVHKNYGDYVAVAGVTLFIDEGEFVSIVGPNGAGKTTLINVLTGLLQPTAGHVHYKGHDISGAGPVKLAQLGMARSFQLVAVFAELTVMEVLQAASLTRLGRGMRLFHSLGSDREVRENAEHIASLFGLQDQLGVKSGQLPQGNKKLLDVASAFALYPEIILLDEPTSGVSTSDKHRIMETLVVASKEIGIKSIIQVEHDMDIVFGYSDRIVALYEGRVLADGSPQEIECNEEVMRNIIGREPVRNA